MLKRKWFKYLFTRLQYCMKTDVTCENGMLSSAVKSTSLSFATFTHFVKYADSFIQIFLHFNNVSLYKVYTSLFPGRKLRELWFSFLPWTIYYKNLERKEFFECLRSISLSVLIFTKWVPDTDESWRSFWLHVFSTPT